MLCRLTITIISLSIMGCVHQKPKSQPSLPLQKIIMVPDELKSATVPIPEKLPCFKQHQAEISRLKKLLAEKDELIQMYKTRQQDLAQALTATTSEVSRAQAKLHRLATQPGTAAKIAEVEVVLKNLDHNHLTESDQQLIKQVQRLLDAATTAYERSDYANAMNYAVQSQAFIEMITNSNRKLSDSQQTVVSLRIPVLLYTTNNINLYMEPSDQAIVLDTLVDHATLSANAYQGNWLRVQTDDGQLGWILNTQVEARIATTPGVSNQH
jgi:hypothetical protein